MQRMLPRSGALFATPMAGAKPMMGFPERPRPLGLLSDEADPL